MVNLIKREGHSHTEFCPHGSGEDVELMIQKAIKLGFQEYSITEHAPLPEASQICMPANKPASPKLQWLLRIWMPILRKPIR